MKKSIIAMMAIVCFCLIANPAHGEIETLEDWIDREMQWQTKSIIQPEQGFLHSRDVKLVAYETNEKKKALVAFLNPDVTKSQRMENVAILRSRFDVTTVLSGFRIENRFESPGAINLVTFEARDNKQVTSYCWDITHNNLYYATRQLHSKQVFFSGNLNQSNECLVRLAMSNRVCSGNTTSNHTMPQLIVHPDNEELAKLVYPCLSQQTSGPEKGWHFYKSSEKSVTINQDTYRVITWYEQFSPTAKANSKNREKFYVGIGKDLYTWKDTSGGLLILKNNNVYLKSDGIYEYYNSRVIPLPDGDLYLVFNKSLQYYPGNQESYLVAYKANQTGIVPVFNHVLGFDEDSDEEPDTYLTSEYEFRDINGDSIPDVVITRKTYEDNIPSKVVKEEKIQILTK